MAVTVRGSFIASEGQPRELRVDVHGWHGWIPDLQEIPDRFRRTGEAGSGRQSLGQEARPAEVKVWLVTTSLGDALLRIHELEILKGYDVRIIDGYGRVLQRCSINDVVCEEPRRCRGPAVGTTASTHRVQAVVTVERQPDPDDDDGEG